MPVQRIVLENGSGVTNECSRMLDECRTEAEEARKKFNALVSYAG